MTTPTSFRILRIHALLRANGSFEGVEAMTCRCQACGKESKLSRTSGLEELPNVVQLTCPTCHQCADVPTPWIWAEWAEQLRRVFGVRVTEVRQDVSASVLDPDCARLLQAAPGNAALQVIRFYCSEARPVQVAVSLYPSGRLRQSIRFKIPPEDVNGG